MEDRPGTPGWVWPAVGAAVIVALVWIALNRGPAEFDRDTPEGTVQAYITALVDGDFETAASLWDDEGCLPESIEPTQGAPDISATLSDVDVGDGEATVMVDITSGAADPLSGLTTFTEWFNLVERNGSWRIRQPAWPYYDQTCEAA